MNNDITLANPHAIITSPSTSASNSASSSICIISNSPNSVSLGFSLAAKELGVLARDPEIFFARRYQPLIFFC